MNEIHRLQDNLDHELEVASARRQTSYEDPGEPKISLDPLVGSWRNCDSDTRGIVGIDFKDKGGTLLVNVFGACSPSPCDWGVVEGTAYAESIVDNVAVAFTAPYDHGFSEALVTGYLDAGTLVVDSFTTFKDGSGRSNYYARAYLCKRG